MTEPRTEAGRVAQYTLPHFDTCAGLHGPNDCDCGVVAHVLAIEAEAAALAAEPPSPLTREALARAIWTVEAQKPGAPQGWTWERFDDEAREVFRAEADAILAALGPSTASEQEAGFSFDPSCPGCRSGGHTAPAPHLITASEPETLECCQFACYEDPGCTCAGCVPAEPETGLDVERLADALTANHIHNAGYCADSHRDEARDIAATYVRLASEPVR